MTFEPLRACAADNDVTLTKIVGGAMAPLAPPIPTPMHALLIAGGIDQVQYDELKDTIIGDIKNFESS